MKKIFDVYNGEGTDFWHIAATLDVGRIKN